MIITGTFAVELRDYQKRLHLSVGSTVAAMAARIHTATHECVGVWDRLTQGGPFTWGVVPDHTWEKVGCHRVPREEIPAGTAVPFELLGGNGKKAASLIGEVAEMQGTTIVVRGEYRGRYSRLVKGQEWYEAGVASVTPSEDAVVSSSLFDGEVAWSEVPARVVAQQAAT